MFIKYENSHVHFNALEILIFRTAKILNSLRLCWANLETNQSVYFKLQISTQKYHLFINILFINGHYADLMVPIGQNSFEDNF